MSTLQKKNKQKTLNRINGRLDIREEMIAKLNLET